MNPENDYKTILKARMEQARKEALQAQGWDRPEDADLWVLPEIARALFGALLVVVGAAGVVLLTYISMFACENWPSIWSTFKMGW